MPSNSIAGVRRTLPFRLTGPPNISYTIDSHERGYPGDVFLFQSHSLRVKANARPVTVIAFNATLKKAAQGVTCKTVSSKNALYIPPFGLSRVVAGSASDMLQIKPG